MRIARLAFMLAVLFATTSATAADIDSRQSLQDSQQFISELNSNIPDGWHARLDYTGGGRGLSIAIESSGELPVQYFYPSAPSGDPPIEHEVVTLWLKCMPFMTPDEFASAKAHNEKLSEKRRSFVRQNLAGIKFGSKGEDPVPPFAFWPATEAERLRVEQYAFEWLNTDPAELPTHSYRSLSFTYGAAPLRIKDAARDSDYHKIVDRLERVLVPYEAQD